MKILKIITIILIIGFSANYGKAQNVDLEKGLITHYRLDGNAYDERGNFSGQMYGNPTPIKDRFGNPNSALSFDGVDDYVDLNTKDFNGTIDINRDFSITLWTKDISPGKTGDYNDRIFSNYNSTRILFAVSGSRFLKIQRAFWIRDRNNKSKVFHMPINENSWNFIVITKEIINEDHVYKIYSNGIYRGLCWHDNNFVGFINGTSFKLFRSIGKTSGYTYGKIDDLRIYKRAINELEIKTLYGDTLKKENNHEITWINPEVETTSNNNTNISIEALIKSKEIINQNNIKLLSNKQFIDFDLFETNEGYKLKKELSLQSGINNVKIVVESKTGKITSIRNIYRQLKNVPEKINGNMIDYQKMISVKSSDIYIVPYSNDRKNKISININGVWIYEKLKLQSRKKQKQKFRIYLQSEKINYLIFKPDNFQTKLTVDIFDQYMNFIQTETLNSSTRKNGAIKIIYKPDK